MAPVNLVILSSSPSTTHYHAPMTVTSSQSDSPSTLALFRNRPKLKMPSTCTKRMSITRQKTSAETEEIKKNDIWDVPDEGPFPRVAEERPPPRPRGRPRKVAAATAEDGTTEAEPRKKRGRPKKLVAEEDEAIALKKKAVRKPRAKKAEEDGQTRIAKGGVTKASSSMTSKAKPTMETTDTVSSHFAAAPTDFIDIDDLSAQSEAVPQDLELKKACERRMTWTPAKKNGNYPHQVENFMPEATQDDSTTEREGFGSLLDSYIYAETERPASLTSMDENNPVRKRKLIDLAKTDNAVISKATRAAKSKVEKKKARTITDKATAEYAALKSETEAAPILQYFSREDSLIDSSGAPRTKAKKTSAKLGKGKKATEAVSTLLAPQAAREHAKRQEFIFGTSSQLAREDDPDFLRDLQEAMQLSNRYDVDDPFAEPLPSLSSKNGFGKATLREAAALIEEEGAKVMEVLDSSRNSHVKTNFNKEVAPDPTAEAEASRKAVLSNVPEADWVEIDQTPAPEPHPRRVHSLSTLVHASSPCIPAKPPVQKVANDANSNTSDSDVPMIFSKLQPSVKTTTPPKPTSQCPDYDSYSTADLIKKIAKYKFKPIKKRGDMVTLLNQCWEAEQKKATGALQHKPMSIETPLPSAQPPPSAKENLASPQKRGRPRKGEPTTALMPELDLEPLTTTKVRAPSPSASPPISNPRKRGRPRKVLPTSENISDVEGPPTPSPPRVRSRQSSPLENAQDADFNVDGTLLPLSPSSAERELLTAISRAITSQSPSGDIKRLSWYERILLYDPILLEDLTKWLNEEGLGRVGYDGEVTPLQVKQWCQRKSVCCLFKESKRNKGVGGIKKIGRE